jgi:hypothetical protein
MVKTLFTGLSGMFLILILALWLLPGFYWLFGFVPILIILSARIFMGEVKRKTEVIVISSILVMTILRGLL